jgi:hypothetical protein
MRNTIRAAKYWGLPALLASALAAQTAAPRSLLGTVTGFRPAEAALEVQPDKGGLEVVRMAPETVVQRVAPGERDLRKAEPMKATGIAIGDRVLVSWVAGAAEARRVIVMGAGEIAKKREADRLDWQHRGLAGVVDNIRGNEITLRSRSFAGEKISTVVVNDKTTFRRYKPDSVKFSDAVASRLSEIRKGDQLRGRGVKSADGTRVDADEVVFGSFLTKAGTVTAVNAETGEITIKDLETEKPLVIRVTADTQLKRMPAMGAMGNRPSLAGGGGGFPGGGMGAGRPGGSRAEGMGPGGPGGGAPDLTQMLERMPAAKLDDFKVGESVVVSSTRGASKDQITAIMLLGNAERLIQMATASSNSRQGGMGGGMMGGGMGGMSGGVGGMMGGLDISGILP